MMRFPPVPSAARAGRLHPFLDVPAYREAQPQLVLELRRARRYEHPLAVAVLSLEGCPPNGRSRAHARTLTDAMPALYGLLGSFLRNSVRETDILTAAPEALAFATFLPNTDGDGAARAIQRFGAGFLDCAGHGLRGGVSAFPGDGLTIEDLLDRACDAWRGEAVPAAAALGTPAHSARRLAHG